MTHKMNRGQFMKTEYGTGMKDQAGLTLFEVLKRLVAIPKYGFIDPMDG